MNKIFISLMIILLLGTIANAQQQLPQIPKKDRPSVALVLSGGGAKGFSHVGVLKVLENEGIPIDLIVGTSIGNLVGGFYAIGYSADTLLTLMRSQNWEKLLSDKVDREYLSNTDRMLKQRYLVSLPIKNKQFIIPQGAMKGQNVISLFSGLSANISNNANFMNFKIPFASISANLATGAEEIATSGNLPLAMYSSMAVPGYFEPARKDGKVLVDGGITNNFPVDIAKNMGADIIIGVDLREGLIKEDEIKSIGDVISNLIDFYSRGKDKYRELCDVIIYPDITNYNSASFTREACDTLYVRGIAATMKEIDKIRELKTKFNLPEKHQSTDLIDKNSWFITQIGFNVDKGYNHEYLAKLVNLPLNTTYNYQDIKGAVDRLYGMDSFKYVYFSISQNNTGNTITFNLESQASLKQSIGFKANTTDVAALLLNVTQKDYSKSLGFLSASVELSANPSIQAIAETNWENFPDLGFAFNLKYYDYKMYEEGKKILRPELFTTSGRIYLEQKVNNLRIGAAIEEQYFSLKFPKKETFLLTDISSYFALDNLDDFYFPCKGTNSYIEANLSIDNKNKAEVSAFSMITTENYFPLKNNFTLIFNGYGRISINNNYPIVKSTFIGGEFHSRYFNYHFPFLGMSPVTIAEQHSLTLAVGVRFKFAKVHYITLLANTLQQGNINDIHISDKAIYGGGIKYSMKTKIGPFDVAMGLSNYHNYPTFSANLGLWF